MQGTPVYAFDHAIVRTPCRAIVDGLRAVDVGAPDYAKVLAEHSAYVKALEEAGVKVETLAALDAYPDSMFVEDPALVFTEGAIVMRPGASSRFGEAAEMTPTLKRLFARVLDLPSPGFADGGDILVLQDRVMIGLSDRTNETGAHALAEGLKALGKNPVIVRTPPNVLHFKSDCSLLDETTMLSTKRLAAGGVFEGLKVLFTPDGEEGAANALRINDRVFVGSTFPQTIAMLQNAGYTVVPLATSEIAKVDAGLSCMSLRWRAE
jgi:dimethylargininase